SRTRGPGRGRAAAPPRRSTVEQRELDRSGRLLVRRLDPLEEAGAHALEDPGLGPGEVAVGVTCAGHRPQRGLEQGPEAVVVALAGALQPVTGGGEPLLVEGEHQG